MEKYLVLWVTTIFWLEFFYQQHLANIKARRKHDG